MTCTNCTGACREGRDCRAAHEATRAVISRFMLHEADGGRQVANGVRLRTFAHPSRLAWWARVVRVGVVSACLGYWAAVVVFNLRWL